MRLPIKILGVKIETCSVQGIFTVINLTRMPQDVDVGEVFAILFQLLPLVDKHVDSERLKSVFASVTLTWTSQGFISPIQTHFKVDIPLVKICPISLSINCMCS
jgi:hypothetical protein